MVTDKKVADLIFPVGQRKSYSNIFTGLIGILYAFSTLKLLYDKPITHCFVSNGFFDENSFNFYILLKIKGPFYLLTIRTALIR